MFRRLVATQAAATSSLDGFGFSCGGQANFRPAGPFALFDGADKVFCLNASLQPFECGTYSYDGDQSLSLNIPNLGSAAATNLEYIDGVLVSFRLESVSQQPCIVQAHHWRAAIAQPNDYVEIRCPIQNPIPAQTGAISYGDNIFSFYPTGNVWGTSRLEMVKDKNTIRRDGHGVFYWDAATN